MAFRGQYYLILSIGAAGRSEVQDADIPSFMEIDWVRVTRLATDADENSTVFRGACIFAFFTFDGSTGRNAGLYFVEREVCGTG